MLILAAFLAVVASSALDEVFAASPCDIGSITVDYKGWTGKCGTEKKLQLATDADSVANSPGVKLSGAKANTKYVLLMVDPDAPPKKPGEYWVHWIANDLNKEDLTSGHIPSSKTTLSYNPPTPPSGCHRYQFYIYVQNSSKSLSKPKSRGRFNLENYMEGFGNAVGGYEYTACK